jgi:hypothetical protein
MEDEGKQEVGSKQGQVRRAGERKIKEERRMYTVLHRQMQMQSSATTVFVQRYRNVPHLQSL